MKGKLWDGKKEEEKAQVDIDDSNLLHKILHCACARFSLLFEQNMGISFFLRRRCEVKKVEYFKRG